MVHVLPDPLEYIRNHPQMFLRSGRVDGRELAAALVADALVLTDGPVTVLRRDGWWIVGCETDWMTRQASASVEDLFRKIVPFPEAGPNSLHSEILLTAFADMVVTSDERAVHPIKSYGEKRPCRWPIVNKSLDDSSQLRMAAVLPGDPYDEPRQAGFTHARRRLGLV